MSRLIALASALPFEPLPNPHMKLFSVNEALEQGIEVPKALLMDYETDYDEPGVIMWSDIEPHIDIEKGIFDIPDPDDNFDIWPMEENCGLESSKDFFAAVEWSRCTPGRAEILLQYIRSQLVSAPELELWNAYLDGEKAKLTWEVKLSELSAGEIFEFCSREDMKEACCLIIRS